MQLSMSLKEGTDTARCDGCPDEAYSSQITTINDTTRPTNNNGLLIAVLIFGFITVIVLLSTIIHNQKTNKHN
jgi:hypothetical protein